MSITYYMDRFRKTASATLILLGIAGIILIIPYIVFTIFLLDIANNPPMDIAAGIVLVNVSAVMYYIIFIIAGFMGRGIAVTMGQKSWKPLVLILSIIFLVHALLLVIGGYLISATGTAFGSYLIIYAIGSLLLLITSILISMKTPAYLISGIMLLIASILMIISITNMGDFFRVTYQPSYIPGILLPISLIIASIALMVYDFIKHKPLIQTVLTIAALIFTIDLILKLAGVSDTIDALSSVSIFKGYEHYIYGTFIPLLLGEIFLGIVGILGLIALIMLLAVIIKSFTQPVAVAPAHQPRPPTMTSYQQ